MLRKHPIFQENSLLEAYPCKTYHNSLGRRVLSQEDAVVGDKKEISW